ncbi:PREDICTED: uncharacterized protein LOC105457341 [Wasmannia auropunctata]|uniref:uncharacterized protein LOC105457341 n=1 Tax=Wasmannia auropunctata TaxID=64793 RepID=UPI0005EEF2A4|nr:PREDICTED: uncharacterized protein LOC105457341 [Wasmannia auropunctata]
MEVCRSEVNMTHGRICSKHFERWCYEKPRQQMVLNYSPARSRKLRLDAIPTLYLFADTQVAERLDVSIPSIHTEDVPSTHTKDAPSTHMEDAPSTHTDDAPSTYTDDVLKLICEATSEIIHAESKATPKTVLEQTAVNVKVLTTSEDVSATLVDHPVIIKNLQQQLADMQKTIVKLETEKKMLAEQTIHRSKEFAFNTLKRIFTPGQIEMLLHPERKYVKWSSEDIASAISLRCVSPKAYRYLRNVIKLPLPGFSTLRRCTASTKTIKESFPR